MSGEFIKPNSIVPAVLGQIANPDDYNQNIAGQSKAAIVGIDEDGSYADVDLGDESLITNGALIKDIKLREGYFLKFYNASGVFQNNVNLGQATESLIGQSAVATQSETDAKTNDLKFITAKKLGNGFAISLGTNGYIKLPSWLSGFMIQWGKYNRSLGTGGFQSITFPVPFPTACLNVQVTVNNSDSVDLASNFSCVVSFNQSGATIGWDRAGSYWFAIGH